MNQEQERKLTFFIARDSIEQGRCDKEAGPFGDVSIETGRPLMLLGQRRGSDDNMAHQN